MGIPEASTRFGFHFVNCIRHFPKLGCQESVVDPFEILRMLTDVANRVSQRQEFEAFSRVLLQDIPLVLNIDEVKGIVG